MKNTTDTYDMVTNLDYLASLSKNNPYFIKEMIRVFLEENPEEISTLEKNIGEIDYNSINSSAHKLRSSISFVGLDSRIGVETAEIEVLSASRSDIEKIKVLFHKVKNTCKRACEELKQIKG